MRAFNQLVFDGQVSGLAAVSTKDEVADLLGKTNDLVLEVEVESSTGTLPTITLDVFHCNSGKVYQAATNGTITPPSPSRRRRTGRSRSTRRHPLPDAIRISSGDPPRWYSSASRVRWSVSETR